MHTIELKDGKTVELADIVSAACASLHISGGTKMFEENVSAIVDLLAHNDDVTYEQLVATMKLNDQKELASAVVNQLVEREIVTPSATPNAYTTNVKVAIPEPVTVPTKTEEQTSEAAVVAPSTEETEEAPAPEEQAAPEVPAPADEEDPIPVDEEPVDIEAPKEVDMLVFIPESTREKFKNSSESLVRLRDWMKRLTRFEYYTPEVAGKIAAYANAESGYVPNRFGGSSLIGMFDNIGYNLKEKTKAFMTDHAEFIVQNIISFLKERPLGATTDAWMNRYKTDRDRYCATLRFFGIPDSRTQRITLSQLTLRRIVDAAVPPRNIPTHVVVGNFAERLHYLMFAIAHLMTVAVDKKFELFSNLFHSKPTEGYIKAHTPDWVKDQADSNKKICSVCGSELIFSNGVYRCTNFLCPKSISITLTESAPYSDSKPARPVKPHRDRHEENEERMNKPRKQHIKRERIVDDGTEEDDAGNPPQDVQPAKDSGKIVFSSGEMPNHNPFEGLVLPNV